MNLKFTFAFVVCSNFIQSQSLVKINADSNSAIQFLEIAGSSSFGSLGAAPSSKMYTVNVLNKQSNLTEALLLNFHNAGDIKSGQLISQKSGSVQIIKTLASGSDEVFFIGNFLNGSGNYLFVGLYSFKIKALKYVKIISDIADPKVLNPVDVINIRGIYYLLLETEISYLGVQNNKMVLMAFDGSQILWSRIYNGVAPIHAESPNSLALGPNDNLLISGTVRTAGDNFFRMMLAEVNTDGEPVALKMVELFSADGLYNHRYGKTFLKPKGANIFMFSQSVVGRSEPGPVLISWFDASLTLRTWRNYTAPIRIEAINSDGFYFYIGGQAPVENGFMGYALMKINSSNAIVEQYKYFKEGLQNSSIATSSAITYDRGNDKTWTLVQPNGSLENYLVLLENNGLIDSDCSEDLTYTVAKDPIKITDLVFNSKAINLQLADFDISLNELNLVQTDLCRVTNTSNDATNSISIYPNPSSGNVSIAAKHNIELVKLFDLSGRLLKEFKSTHAEENLELGLKSGVYFLNIKLANSKQIVQKLVIAP